ncbi:MULTISPECIES: acetate/propionate family kinase [unclassified Fusibacter]|uniref:acetate/propionate family kinase n=1 Tax=unclassified Fusibacter TaxID=2624464 RepID=UPI001013AEA2|nr:MULTISPECIES: acetate kinase [unclassified Fusibacter]MCK8058070.1 acetate kinase [Fusibacter sp. A2]NPE20652.1 acetate kinase [Fusibacter sp. A1]RXV62858.1 acetate kinase [Fusibacter sp. A1]
MNILVINCGSSSLKYQLINMNDESVLANGLVERIGLEGSRLKHQAFDNEKVTIEVPMNDHKEALNNVLAAIVNPEYGSIKELNEINAVGHRVVHAGEKYSASVIIDKDVIAALEECIELAPLHNPPNLMGIEAMQELLPGVPMVGVFDTAFHQTMPEVEYIYPLPYEMYQKYGVRRYGFHGTSHRYVSQRAADILGKDIKDLRLIVCHLGNGASLCAIDGGKSVVTSMGFTPLEGLVMGTRCGDIDPAIVTYLMEKENLDVQGINDVLNKQSGVFGISGISSDFRDIENAAFDGDKRAQLALDSFDGRVRKYIAAYATVMGGVDAVIFTAGLGENSAMNRASICDKLQFMGIEVDAEKNNVRGKEAIISKDNATVKVMVVPTNEELMIARDTLELVSK